jgi:hypothetical protein
MPSWLALVAAAALTAPADIPIAAAPVDGTCLASVDEAATAALTLAMALPPTIEHGGAIYERGEGCFVFSAPVTNGHPMRVRYKVLTSPALRLAGLYHTHTTRAVGDAFSADDVLQARASDVPSFVGVHGFNHIRKLRRGYQDYGPRELMDPMLLRRTGVKGVVLARLPPSPSCRDCS